MICIKDMQMHYMSEELGKLRKIMEHIRILVDELPLHDDDVRNFLKTIQRQVWRTSSGEWISTLMQTEPTTFNEILKYGRGNDQNIYDPFYMIHEIKLAYSDKDVDRRVRQIASYFEAFIFFYRNHEIQTAFTEMRRNTETKQTVLGEGVSSRVDSGGNISHRDGNLLFLIQSL
jgi:hypothetical protein